jgi:hypothetical protein
MSNLLKKYRQTKKFINEMTYGFSSSDMLYSWLKYKQNEECKKNFGVLFPSINPSVKLLPTVTNHRQEFSDGLFMSVRPSKNLYWQTMSINIDKKNYVDKSKNYGIVISCFTYLFHPSCFYYFYSRKYSRY